jgi:16S rRNA (cytosine1402-N4)-methyltransferase
MLEETVSHWLTRADGIYIDGTFGRGGHSKRLLEQLSESAQLLVIDKDPEAIAEARSLQSNYPQIQVEHGDFADMARFVSDRKWQGKITGILVDLGVSSPQLDTASRGFSFMQNGPLDMRMNPTQGASAAQWLAAAEWQDIAQVLREYGEERFARRIAQAVVHEREKKPIQTTADLVAIIEAAVPKKDPGKHKATRSFQAIRIYINQELAQIEKLLEQSLAMLAPGGRLAVISFHSLEDRIVKRFMQRQIKGEAIPASIPLRADQIFVPMRSIVKAQKSSAQELAQNPRARSAILRVVEKLADQCGAA